MTPYLLMMPLALVLAATEAPAQSAKMADSDLINDCKNYPESPRPRTCAVFIRSFIEISQSGDKTVNPRGKLCIGKDVTVAELATGINEWLARNPGAAKKVPYDIAYDALGDRYRCK